MKTPNFAEFLKQQIADDQSGRKPWTSRAFAKDFEQAANEFLGEAQATPHERAERVANAAHDLWLSLRPIAVGAEKLPEDVLEIIIVLGRVAELTGQSLQLLATRARMEEIKFDE